MKLYNDLIRPLIFMAPTWYGDKNIWGLASSTIIFQFMSLRVLSVCELVGR